MSIHTKSKLLTMKVTQLREECGSHDLTTTGLKQMLINRLMKHYKSLKEAAGDEPEYYNGTVKSWMKAGFGFIQTEDVDDDGKPVEIFVHRSDISMAEGEEAHLRKGMEVMFREEESDSKKNKGGTHAVDVKRRDGEPISWWKRTGESDRVIYDEPVLGIIGDFRYFERTGYVLLMDEVVTPEGETVTINEKLRVRRRDFVTTGERPSLHPGREVQFKLWKDDRGFGATQIQTADGEALGKLEPPTKGSDKIDEETRYTGRVLVFRMNNHGFIAADEDLSKFGVQHKLYFKTEDIISDSNPAMVAVGMPVSFTIYKDGKGVGAKNIGMPDGTGIEMPEGYEFKPYSEMVPRESFSDLKYEGTVKSFFWDKGFGYIKLDMSSNDVEIPEEVKKEIKDDQVYFRWDDLNSEDKVVGINKDVKVECNLYKDEKGIGAENISKPGGDAISGQDRSKGQYQRRRWNNRGRGRRGWKRRGNWSYNQRKRRY